MILNTKITYTLQTVLILTALTTFVQPVSSATDDDGSTLYYSANALYNQKLYTLAVGEYKTFMEKHPQHEKIKDAHYGLALCYYFLGKHTEAEPELQTVISYGTIGDTNQLHLMLGQCQLKMNKPAEAEKSFTILTSAEEPGSFTDVALAGLAEAQFRQNKWDATITTTDRITVSQTNQTSVIRALYQGGYSRHQMQKYKEAIPLLEKLLGLNPAENLALQASFILAECCRETGDLGKAEKYYTAAINLEGSTHEVYYRLGFVRFMQKDYAGAVSALEQSLKIKPDSTFAANARIYIARALIEQKEYAKTVELLKPAEGAQAPDDEASLWLARAYTLQNSHEQAAKVLQSALERFPQSGISRELRFDLANAQIAGDNFKPAGDLLAQLVDDPKWEQKNDTTRLYAICLHKTGDYAKSLVMANKFLETSVKDSSIPDIIFLKAENLYLSDKIDEAMAVYGDFVKNFTSHPNVDAARLRMAQVHYRKNRMDEALELAKPIAAKNLPDKVFSDIDFLIGDCNFRLEQWDGAIKHLTAFIAKHPSDDQRIDTALVELGVSEVRKDNSVNATSHFTKLVENHPKSPHCTVAYAELGRINYEAGRNEPARTAMLKCLELAPKGPQEPKAKYYLGWISLKENKNDEALKHFQDLVTSYPDHKLSADASLQLGLLQLAAKNYAEANKTLGAFLAKNPEHPETVAATYTLGVASARAGDKQNAVAQFTKVADNHSDSEYADSALYEMAWCYKELNNKKEASKAYERLLEKYPDSKLATRVRVELAELTFENKDYDRVIAELESTLTNLTEKDLREQTLYRLGTAYFNKGAFDKGAKTFEDMAVEFPNSKLIVSAIYQAAESRLKLGETEAARNHFLAVIKMNPDAEIMESALMRLGETDSLTKRWEEASGNYRTFLEKFPNSKWIAQARFGYAFALEKQGKHTEAIPEYRRIVAEKSKDELAVRSQFQIGECLFALKNYDEAIKELVRVTVNYGDQDWTAKALLETGRILEAKGDRDNAIEQFRKIIEKHPGHDVAVVAKQRLDALRRSK